MPAPQATTADPLDGGASATPLDTLRQYWGYDSFRGIQQQIIESILAGRDTLGLMPTGGGKSITFQVPAMMMPGTCIVVTPLVALMKDQVMHLKHRGIKATAIHSGLPHSKMLREFDNAILGHYKFLYVSPERLTTTLFLDKLKRLHVCFITVDEAHCISQWGYDFRPAYLRIRELREHLPGVPVLALTATATPVVVDDIQRQLDFGRWAPTRGTDTTDTDATKTDANAASAVFRMSFDRPNLAYRVVRTDSKASDILHTLSITEGSAIVYTRSRSGCRDLALCLQQQGISASYYHAGLSPAEKDTRQQMWQKGRARVMVATNAFGMGIDKADVRLVLHLDAPDSLEAYFQEAGRAGRDGRPATAILYYSPSDTRLLRKRVQQTFPPKEKVREIYDDIACFFQLAVDDGLDMRYEFNIDEFCRRFHYFPATVESALRILQRAGYLTYNEEDDTRSRVMFIVRRDDLYDFRINTLVGDRVLQSLLRHYEALFSDYVNIDESLLAKDCDCTEDDVYEALLGLTRRRILHYVPRKNMPAIVYTQRRVAHSRIGLPPEVYEERLEQYIERITAVTRYLEDDVTPRRQQLLEYFGEFSTDSPERGETECPASQEEPVQATDGGSLTRSAAPATADSGGQTPGNASPAPPTAPQPPTDPLQAIVGILSDGAPHHPTELRALPFALDAINDAILRLLDQGRTTIADGHFILIT